MFKKILSLLIAFIFTSFCFRCDAEQINIKTYRKEAIIPLLPLLNEWAKKEFAHAPYLFVTPDDQIICPSDLLFVNSKEALIAFAKSGEEVVGMAAMISFDDPVVYSNYFNQHDPSLADQFKQAGYDPAEMLYVAYFLTSSDRHNDPLIVHPLYNAILDFAREKGKSQLCYMDDRSTFEVSSNDLSYVIEPWREMIPGFKNTGLTISIPWMTELDGAKEKVEHTLEFCVKSL